MTKTQMQYLVIGLAGLWAGLIVLRVTVGEMPQDVASVVTPTIQAVGKRSPGAQGLHVQSLDHPARNRASAPKRNIFVAGSSALAVEEQGPRVTAKKPRRLVPSPPVPPPVEVVSVPPAPPEPTPEERAEQEGRQQRELAMKHLKEQMEQYRYLGVLIQDGEHKAFLGKGHEIYILRRGDRLDGKFVVSSVGMAAVKLRAVESDLETTIHLKKEHEGKPS